MAEERRKTEAERRKTARRMLRELGKQIDGLGNKFGLFTGRIAIPPVAQLALQTLWWPEDFAVGRQNRIGAGGDDGKSSSRRGSVVRAVGSIYRQ